MTTDPKAEGYVTCPECGARPAVRRQKNGRLYFNCMRRCGGHHRFSPDILSVTQIAAIFKPTPASVVRPADEAPFERVAEESRPREPRAGHSEHADRGDEDLDPFTDDPFA